MTTHITYREQQVIKLVAQNKCNKEIAWELGVHIKTVEKLRNVLMCKLGLHCGIDLTHFAICYGIIQVRRDYGTSVIFLDKNHKKNTLNSKAKSEKPFI
jgi:hypothetical protein